MTDLTLSHLSALDVAPADLAAPAARAGFSAIGLRLAPAAPGLISYPLPVGSDVFRETKARLADAGIGVWDVELVPLTPGFEPRAFAPMFETAAALGARRVNVTGDDPEASRLVDSFARVCALAAQFGLRVDLEFMRWRVVGNFAQACEVARRAGAGNGGVLLDMLHVFRAGDSIAGIAAAAELVSGAQLADAPRAAPPEDKIIEEARTRRLPPGEGELPLIELIRALPENLPFAVEVPPRPESPAPLDAHLVRLHAAARRLLAAARAGSPRVG